MAGRLPDETFTYDPVGNRRSSYLSTTHVYDAANRLLEDDAFTYSYDANGNRIEKRPRSCPAPPAPCPAATRYTYDVENQLVTLHSPLVTAQYRYDALGRRIEKDVDGVLTRYLYDQEDLVAVFRGPTNCQTHAVFHGPGIDQPLLFFRDTNADCNPFRDGTGFGEPLNRLLPDGLGSPTVLVSPSVETPRCQGQALHLRQLRDADDPRPRPRWVDGHGRRHPHRLLRLREPLPLHRPGVRL
ncbi:MAG: hypothetical protein HYY58_03490 [Candidatus Omnitrophica bacterium]|nr:hypothetical protein [Candidatus Omnitrophota bacterium]